MAKPNVVLELEGNSFRNLHFFLLIYLVGSLFLQPYPAMALLVPLLGLYWLGVYDIIDFTLKGAYLLPVIYFGLLIYSYVFQISRSRKVSGNVLYAAFCLYLIIELFRGAAYALLNQFIPGSYSGVLLHNSGSGSTHIFNYFSIVTLTTLGYGDITPKTSGAAALVQ